MNKATDERYSDPVPVADKGQEGEAKFTAGPWSVARVGEGSVDNPHGLWIESVGFSLAEMMDIDVRFLDHNNHRPDQKANAHLIAAAPELYEALTSICDSLRARQGSKLIHIDHDELMKLIPQARAALEKARQGATHAS